MEKLIPSNKSAPPCSPQVTFMRECEAREWIQRYRDKTNQVGSAMAQHWWEVTKANIAKIRGQDGLDILIAEMYRQRDDANTLSSRG
jgi:hypothetical protein